MANLTNIYSDIDLRFSPQPSTGDVSMLLDNRAVISSVKNLILTNFYERPWQPTIGSNMNFLLFENVTTLMETTIAKEVENVIKNFEPRVNLDTVKVVADPRGNGYTLSLSFFVGNNTQATNISLFLERNR